MRLKYLLSAFEETKLDFRIGIHSGKVAAGIIGKSQVISLSCHSGTLTQGFDLWGDTINVSARMAKLAQPNSIQITDVST